MCAALAALRSFKSVCKIAAVNTVVNCCFAAVNTVVAVVNIELMQ